MKKRFGNNSLQTKKANYKICLKSAYMYNVHSFLLVSNKRLKISVEYG